MFFSHEFAMVTYLCLVRLIVASIVVLFVLLPSVTVCIGIYAVYVCGAFYLGRVTKPSAIRTRLFYYDMTRGIGGYIRAGTAFLFVIGVGRVVRFIPALVFFQIALIIQDASRGAS